MAALSLARNRAFLLNQFVIGLHHFNTLHVTIQRFLVVTNDVFVGSVVFGICPVLFALYDLFDDLLKYWETKEAGLR